MTIGRPMMTTERIYPFIYHIFLLTLLLIPINKVYADLQDDLTNKVKAELIQQLNERGHPELAAYLNGIDPQKLGTYAGRISAGEGKQVLEQIFNEKKDAASAFLWDKSKDYAQGVVGPEAIRWLEFAESHAGALEDMVGKTYAGDWQGAGNTFWTYAKDQVKAKLKEKVKQVSMDAVKNALNSLFGHVVKDAGGWYLAVVELWIQEIKAFEEYMKTESYKFSFRKDNNPNNPVITRTLCIQFASNRRYGFTREQAFTEQNDKNPSPVPLIDMIYAGGQGSTVGQGGRWWRQSKWNFLEENGRNLSKEELINLFEACYIRLQISRETLKHDQIRGLTIAHKHLFGTIKKGMDIEKAKIITIFDQFKNKIPTKFELHIKVTDTKTNNPLKDVLLHWDGNSDKTNKNGLVIDSYPLKKLDSNRNLYVRAYKLGYKDTELSFTFQTIKSTYSADTNTAEVKIPMQPLEKLKLTVYVKDKETKKFLSTDATIKADFQKEQNTTFGKASFDYKYVELKLAQSSGITKLILKTSASGYKSDETSILIDRFIEVSESTTDPELTIYLEKEAPKNIELIVDLVDANSGKEITEPGNVKPDHQVEQSIKNGSASFTFKVSELRNHALLGMTNIAINTKVNGYKQKDSVTVTAKELLEKIADNKTSLTVTILMVPDSSASIDHFEVKCDKPEIFEDQTSICEAVIYDKAGNATDVSKQASWTPVYVDLSKGKVAGLEVAKIESLPYTVNAEATFIAPKNKGGKTWTANKSVLVKPRGSLPQPGITVSKSSNKSTIHTGDLVTYSYQLNNPGNVPLSNVSISDDKCAPVNFVTGDSNRDSKLDLNETWLYECTMALSSDTTNRVQVLGEDASGSKVNNSATATVKVLSIPIPAPLPCPPPKVVVPSIIGQSEAVAKDNLKLKTLRGVVIKREYNKSIAIRQVITQSPLEDECVDPNSAVNLWVSHGPEKSDPPLEKAFTAEFDCGDSFELEPGNFLGRSCGIIVRGWKDTDARVKVKFSYSKSNGIEIIPGNWSAAPFNMFNPGISDYYDRYIFTESFKAKDDAPSGVTPVTITVSQKGAGSITLETNVFVLPKGIPASSGAGIRPPAIPVNGSGGEYCVWRYKMFGDRPNCFNFAIAKCGKPLYAAPNYELVGVNMTWGEAGNRMVELGSYFDDAYDCREEQIVDTDGDGTSDNEDLCPNNSEKIVEGQCGCDLADTDTDNDGIPDCLDRCTKGIDRDTDGDGFADCEEKCPTNPDRQEPDECGSCWVYDTDKDGVLDCEDECPNDPKKTEALQCGCNESETDTDGDLWPDCIDQCPSNPEKTALKDDIEVFLKKIDSEIQPARKALHDCKGMSVFSDLKNLKAQLIKEQCDSAPGISIRLKEIEFLEKTIDPKNCSGEAEKACDIAPNTTSVKTGEFYGVSDRFWGFGGTHCYTSEEASKSAAVEGRTIKASGDKCTKCPKGFGRAVYNGSEACIKCPEGKHYSNGCCR